MALRRSREEDILSPNKSMREVLTPEMKEKMLRLEADHKQLTQGLGDKSVQQLLDELDVAKGKARAFEDKYIAERRSVLQMESLVKKKEAQQTVAQSQQSQLQSAKSQEADALRDELARVKQELAAVKAAASASPAAAAGHNNNGSGSAAPIPTSPVSASSPAGASPDPQAAKGLDAVLARNKKLEAFAKQAQRKLKLSEDRVTKVLHQNGELAEQLKARELELREREKIRLATKQATAREQRLMSSAFYELGMEYHSALSAGKATLPGSSADKSPAKVSWINKQRAKAAS